jgi:hypothetical protein
MKHRLDFKDITREEISPEESALVDSTCCGKVVQDSTTGDVIIISGGMLMIGNDVTGRLVSPQELLLVDNSFIVELSDNEDTRANALDMPSIEVLPEIFQCDSVKSLWTSLEDYIF